MNDRLRDMLDDLAAGRQTVDEVHARLRDLPFVDLGFAKVDHHRAVRCGFPEVVFCQGKTTEQAGAIFEEILAKDTDLLATRVDPALWADLAPRFPDACFHEAARVVTQRVRPAKPTGLVAVLAAGTADIPVAEEARLTAEMLGASVVAHYDVGVAGIHRLFDCLDDVHRARCAVVVAGMEGALASVVGGLVDMPVVAVPTSVGYGACFNGVAPLLAMLNSCAAQVSVVNIDNGFGAGYVAALVNRVAEKALRAEK